MRAILFDFGGTIDTDGVHWSERYWELYTRFNLKVTKPEYEESFLDSEKLMAADEKLRHATFKETLDRQLFLQFESLHLRTDSLTRGRMVAECYGEVKETISRATRILHELKSRYKLGVVSNFYGNLDTVCAEFGLDRLFDVKIDSAVAGIRKPDPAIFALALTQLGVRGKETYIVGDSYDRDIVPGKRIGCTTIWLKGTSWSVPPSTIAADHVITKFNELTTIL